MKTRINLLIDLLFDDTASITERDEAAAILGEFADTQLVNALLFKSRDLIENKLVLNSCGESLGAIWVKQKHRNFLEILG